MPENGKSPVSLGGGTLGIRMMITFVDDDHDYSVFFPCFLLLILLILCLILLFYYFITISKYFYFDIFS